MMRPEALDSISKTIRPGVADTRSFCLRGIPAARRSSRESTIRLEASSSTVVFMALLWRGHGVFASSQKRVDEIADAQPRLRDDVPLGFEGTTRISAPRWGRG